MAMLPVNCQYCECCRVYIHDSTKHTVIIVVL